MIYLCRKRVKKNTCCAKASGHGGECADRHHGLDVIETEHALDFLREFGVFMRDIGEAHSWLEKLGAKPEGDALAAEVERLRAERDDLAKKLLKARQRAHDEVSRVLTAVLALLGHKETEPRTETAMMLDIEYLVDLAGKGVDS